MNEIKITVELSEHDRQMLDFIGENVSGIYEMMLAKWNQEQPEKEAPAKEESKEEPKKEAPKKEEPAKEEPKKDEPPEPAITVEQVQAMVQKLAAPSAGFRDQVRGIVKDYADRVSQIPEAKLSEVMTRLNALTAKEA